MYLHSFVYRYYTNLHCVRCVEYHVVLQVICYIYIHLTCAVLYIDITCIYTVLDIDIARTHVLERVGYQAVLQVIYYIYIDIVYMPFDI